MRSVIIAWILLAQIMAGTPEDKLFQRILAERNPDEKLLLLADFEIQFSQSKALPDIYLMMIDLYRQKENRTKIIEYGEKTLKADKNNVTAMIVLSRNYALERTNLDRAVMLAVHAINLLMEMKRQPPPTSYTEVQWKEYLQSTEGSARSILDYAKALKVN